MKNVNNVFIGGHRKCGTTLFLNLLDGHPGLCVYPQDAYIFYAYYPVYCQGGYTNKERLDRLDTVIFKHMKKRYTQKGWLERLDLDLMRGVFFDNIKAVDLLDIGRVFEELMRSFRTAQHLDDRSLVEVIKETSIELDARFLLSRFANSKFIHILRDPRDNYAALSAGIRKRYHKFSDDENTILASLINRYGLGMQTAALNQLRFGEGRYLILRHEDIVTKTKEQMEKVCEFLEIPFDKSMLVPTVLGGPTRGNNFEDMDMSRVSPVNVGRWQERIDDFQACVIEFYFREYMQKYGYECAFSEIEQSDMACDFYKWSNYHYHYYDHFAEP